MKKNILFLFLVLFYLSIIANDGTYYASGNQLIPINETEISITKEILSIVRKDDGYIYVTVDYLFYNPVSEKTVLVGFEAPSPSGDLNGYPVNGRHPYINDFDVTMNSVLLHYKVAIVNEKTYYINGKINAKTENQVINDDFNSNSPDFYYVYYFNANFKKGINRIVHTYKFNASKTVLENYSFDYILTAATRWANKQINDFTLNIRMGNDEAFSISNTFFSEKDKWTIDNGRSSQAQNIYTNNPITKFITFSGGISYSKKNFVPKGELYLSSPFNLYFDIFNYKEQNLPDKIDINAEYPTVSKSKNENSYKILRNFPFAIRGYVFKTKIIQNYYLTQKWYKPNPKYKAVLENLTSEEREWLNKVKTNKWNKN